MSSRNDHLGQKAKKPRVEAWCYTASKGDTKFSFIWTIENFSRKMEFYNSGQYLTSDTFKVEIGGKETAWCLVCYPNGRAEDSANNVCLCLQADNDNAMNNMKIRCSFALQSKDGLEVKKHLGSVRCFSTVKNVWGWKKFTSHEELKAAKDNVLFDDRLTVLCVMEFDGKESTTSGVYNPTLDKDLDPQEEHNGSDLLELLKNGYLSDVEVVSEGRSFSCHKVILGSKSPVFRATLEHDMKEKASGKITIEGIEPDITEGMLTHIYGGKIENLEEKADKLLIVADKYDLKKLKKWCENIMARTLNISTCLQWLVLADLHSTERLKPVVIKFVAENLREVAAQDSWKEMKTNHSKILMEVIDKVAQD